MAACTSAFNPLLFVRGPSPSSSSKLRSGGRDPSLACVPPSSSSALCLFHSDVRIRHLVRRPRAVAIKVPCPSAFGSSMDTSPCAFLRKGGRKGSRSQSKGRTVRVRTRPPTPFEGRGRTGRSLPPLRSLRRPWGSTVFRSLDGPSRDPTPSQAS